MKKTQWIELFNRIKETIVSFIAILFFVCFGIALFIGIGWSKSAIEETLDNEFIQNNFHNYEVLTNYKITDSNIVYLSSKYSNYEFEGSYSTFAYFNFNNRKLQAKIVGITSDIDKLFLIKGQLAINDDEIVIENNWAKRNNIEVGDYIEFETSNGILKNTKYIVTGLADSPAYFSHLAANYEISTNGGNATNCIMYVSNNAFNSLPGYNELYIRVKDLDKYSTLSDEYKNNSDVIKNTIDSGVSNIVQDSYSVLTRNDNGSVFAINIIAGLFNKLKYNFACMFIIIGFMICYSTISRLVYIDTMRIGTKKALGFNSKEIMKSYLLYIVIVSSLGCILGALLGRFVIEPFFIKILSGTFVFSPVIYYFSLKELLIISALEIGIMSIICIFSCKSVLNKKLVVLLQGYEIPDIKSTAFEKTKLWKKISLLTKCMLNNLIYDKRRVIATLIGITGCTALLVCALSFQFSITGTSKRQFEIQKYNYTVSYDYRSENAEANIEEYLNDNNLSFEKASLANTSIIQKDGNTMVARLLVGYDADFNNMIEFNSNGIKQIPDNDVWVSIGYAKEYDYSVGDYIKIIDSNSVTYELKIGGIFEYYQQVPYLVMSKNTYKGVFDKDPIYNVYLVSNNEDYNSFKENIANVKGTIGVKDDYSNYMSTQSIIITVSTAIIVIYIVLSLVIALCIILDLFVLFIEERKIELITIMINGYSRSSAKRYIYSDTILLSIIGILFGGIIGTFMCKWTINSVNSDMSYYMNDFNIGVCSISCIISAFIICVMCIVSLRRIDKFKLSDINT